MLTSLKVALGEHLVTALPILALALIELPVVSVGRSLGLPIEKGGIAFIPYNLNWLGYKLVWLFWGAAGFLLGGGIDLARRQTFNSAASFVARHLKGDRQ